MSTLPKSYLTPEEYLEIECQAELKSEYFQGEIFAMAGASEPHNLIVANTIILVGQQFRSRPCRVYPSDMRVSVGPTGIYTYPDVVAVCGTPKFLDDRRDTLLNPTVLVEVLSPSTELYDRTRKSERYRSIESLREYLMISSDRIHAELFARQPNGRWTFLEANQLEDTIELPSAGCQLKLADLYDKVEL